MADADGIAGLSSQLGYPVAAGDMATRLAHLLASDAHHVFVAADGTALLGWIAVERRITLEAGTSHEITGLVVDADRRRGGAGRALVAAAIGWARRDGAGAVVVRSNALREASHAFYQSLGFARTKTQHVYRIAMGG